MNTDGFQLGFSNLQLGLSPRSNVSIQCFWHGFPDSRPEIGPVVVWPHECFNNDFQIHMQNGWPDLGSCISSSHFANLSPELRCMVHVVVPEHKGGGNEIGSVHRSVFVCKPWFHALLVAHFFFCNNSRLSLMHRFCASGMASKHMRGPCNSSPEGSV